MYEILPSPKLASLLHIFKGWGGVVNYILVGLDEKAAPDIYELHKEIAIFTAQTLLARHTRHLLLDKDENFQLEDWLREEERKGIQVRPDEAKGQLISIAEFFAPDKSWAMQDGTLLAVKPLLHPLLEERGDTFLDGLYIPSKRNYFHAFCDPPYGLSARYREIERLFERINKQLFGESLADIVIYQWSTDWIDYLCFYEGYDWWGSYLWTVYDTKTKMYVGVIASETD